MSHPRCARLFFLHSDFCQDVGARCSDCPTEACSSPRTVWTLTCHRDDTGVSGRKVSFKPDEGKGHGSDEGFQRHETQQNTADEAGALRWKTADEAGVPQVEDRPNGAGVHL